MLLRMDAEGSLHQEGFQERVLEDGRSCLLWARGYFFDSSGHMWLDGEIVDWLVPRLGTDGSLDMVSGMNGCFSFAIVWPAGGDAQVAIDRYGTVPVYYHMSDGKLVISDDYWNVVSQLAVLEYDSDAVLSMVLFGYVIGYRTLLCGITELEQAATHCFSYTGTTPQLTSQRYWRLATHKEQQHEQGAWQRNLAQTLDLVFRRHAEAISYRNWDLYVPLSGGKDSRLIAGLFSRHGVMVHAFSYGPSGNPETACASQVADALSIPLQSVCVDDPFWMEPGLICTMTRRVGMRALFTVGLGAQLSLTTSQDQRVYVPGHSGALLAGGTLKRGVNLVRSEAQAVRHLANNHSLPVLEETAAVLFPKTRVADTRTRLILSNWHYDVDDPIGSVNRWNLENNQRRLILSELRTYEQFGLWMLPFYDYDLIDFFAQVPFDLRYRQRLFIETLVQNILVNDLAALARIPIAYKGALQSFALSWRDRVVGKIPPSSVGDWILRRATRSKRREHLQSIGAYPPEPTGPEPLDYWWPRVPSLRLAVADMFRDWSGVHGIVDVEALLSVLEEPMPRYFVKFGIPALLTLCFFQKILEHEYPGYD